MATTAAARKPPPASQSQTPARSTASTASTAARPKRQKDACDLLDADHKAVKAMFQEFEALIESRSRSPAKKRQLAEQICQALTLHAAIEEEIFYPAVRGAINDNALMNEAVVEHASVKDLIAQIEEMDVGDDMFDATVTVLGEYVDHHVKEERSEMFAKARKTKVDLVKLRGKLQERRQALMDDMAAQASSRGREVSAAL